MTEAYPRDLALQGRNGRTPFRLNLKFTPEEWRLLGRLANAADRSRYNFAKRAVLGVCEARELAP